MTQAVPGVDWDITNVPILFDRDPGCIWGGVVVCQSRYNPLDIDMADRIQEAMERSNLDITVYRGKGHELFIEGAREILWRGRDAPSWNTLFAHVSKVTEGAVPFGRIINNTVVGMGGQLTDTRSERVTPLASSGADEDYVRVFNDFQDVGIEISDNADPTLLNNVLVNFEYGIAADFTAIETVRGGLVYQGNEQESLNTRVGDFAILLDNDDPLFVDTLNGNFYPAEGSVIIDSSIDSLEERPELLTVKDRWVLLLRRFWPRRAMCLVSYAKTIRIPNHKTVVGLNAFKDRGAIDRVDFCRPRCLVAEPDRRRRRRSS